jgi:inner membrane protein
MDSITQIVLGAAMGEAAAGRKMGIKAALWGAFAGTVPDLDVFARALAHPIDGALIHRGFSHSIAFAIIASPIFGWLLFRLYKRKYELKKWIWLFFLAIITHPMLDIFTNYGTQLFWPFDVRLTFNSVFVIDPLYTLPFLLCLIIAVSLKREKKWRRRWNNVGIIYSSMYLVWCVAVKLVVLDRSVDYFATTGIKSESNLVTPMPFTSFYWMMIGQDSTSFYVGYKSLFYDFNPNDIDIIPKNQLALDTLKWRGKNYTEQLKFITNDYYATEYSHDTLKVYDLRFGVGSKLTNEKIKTPVMGYGMVIDNGFVNKTEGLRPKRLWEHANFGSYFDKIFKE